ncbi:MAG: hypothetical protein IJA10_10655 [Lachnospiraceae bacterium]|nr:hypothetical protein [Lachnospiraceae bacterium]
MYKYILYYDGGFLCDSSELNDGYTFETEKEAKQEAETEIDNRILYWELEEVEYDRELFSIKIEVV